MKANKLSVNFTNILLGAVAAQVVYLTVRAIAERQSATGHTLGSAAPAPLPQKPVAPSRLREALHHVASLLRLLFSGSKEEITPSGPQVRQRLAGPAKDEGVHLQGSRNGIAEKLQDPAWAGVLAANHGNISLTDAERAVPIPDSARFVERLDRTRFPGNGLKGLSQQEHAGSQAHHQVRKIPGRD